jgi:hypothetical protein
MQNFELLLQKGLPILTDKLGKKFIVDTGSPSSFSGNGQLDLGDGIINLPKNIRQVDIIYLQDNVGIQLDGLLGLDILSKKAFSIHYHSLLFSIYDNINEIKTTEGAQYFEATPMFLKIPVLINNIRTSLILDTGAHNSYLNPEFVNVDISKLRQTNDFNPLMGNFEVKIVDELEYSINDIIISHEVGISPNQLVNMLNQLRVGGVFGYELFNKIDFYYLKDDNRVAINFI